MSVARKAGLSPLALRQAGIVALLAFLSALFAGALQIVAEVRSERERLRTTLNDALDRTQGAASVVLWNLDPAMANVVVEGLAAAPEVATAALYDAKGVVFAIKRRLVGGDPLADFLFGGALQDERTLSRTRDDGKLVSLGVLTVQVDGAMIIGAFLERAARAALLSGLQLAALACLVVIVVNRSLIGPLRALEREVGLAGEDFAAGRLARVKIPDGHEMDELGALAQQFSHVLERLKDYQDRVGEMATRDPLTGLANRALLEASLDRAIGRASRNGSRFAVLFLDLDRFKEVNDALGHSAGDELLCLVAARLHETMRPGDELARFGGDEFVVLLESQADDAARAAAVVADRLVDALRIPFELSERSVGVGVSIGIALYPEDGRSREELLSRADSAMYLSKARGGGMWRRYDRKVTALSGERGRIDAELRTVPTSDFQVFFQPRVTPEGRLIAVEALLRWQRGGHLLAPASFLPGLEDGGRLVEVGGASRLEAMQRLAAWRATGHAFGLAINLSPRQLQAPGFAQTLLDDCGKTGLPPDALTVEVGEAVLVHDHDRHRKVLEELRKAGVRIALDDLGSGFCSLAHLRRLPLDLVKIDRTLTDRLPGDDGPARLVMSIARALAVPICLEGVETLPQVDWARKNGIAVLQGDLFGTAMPADRLQSDILAAVA